MSRKRYSTYLRGAKSDRQPSRLGALAVVASPAPYAAGASRRTLRLDRWEMETWPVRGGTAGASTCASGYDPTLWLDMVARLMERPGPLTVLCPRAVQALSLLGVWDLIDRGVLALDRVPLLVGDPPTCLSLYLTDRPGRLLLIDTANYGVHISADSQACARTAAFARSMVSALTRCGMGALQSTAGAQAMYGYRRSYMSSYCSTHTRAGVLALERESLYGGRAECYRLGRLEGPIYYLDYSGYYASIMSEIDVPVRLRHWGHGYGPQAGCLLDARVPMVARVRVRTESPRWPCVRDGLTVWPVGDWWTVLAGPELDDAWHAGCVEAVADWASYDAEPALAEYARACLSLRADATAQGDKDLARWAKSLAVCLVGKFGQRRREWEDRPRADVLHRWGTWPYVDQGGHRWTMRGIAGLVQRERSGGETETSCPAIAAWIYAEGRRRLWAAQVAAGRDNVLYCHTDSLFCTEAGYANLCAAGLVGQGEAGRLSLKATWPWIEILGISHYRVPGRTVCAGVVGSGGVGLGDGPAQWRGETARTAVADRHPPRPVEICAPGERHSAYRHGARGEGGIVHPWRI